MREQPAVRARLAVHEVREAAAGLGRRPEHRARPVLLRAVHARHGEHAAAGEAQEGGRRALW